MNAPSERPSCLVVGAGGVGVATAYSLSRSGQSVVSLVVRSDFDHVVKNGYQLDSRDYGMVEKWRPDHLFQTAEGAAQSGMFFDYIVVTVKNVPDGSTNGTVSNIIRPILESNRTILGDRVTNILLVQNGIDIEKELLEEFKEAQYKLSLLSGVQMIASTKIGPGIIKQKGQDSLSVGPFNPDDHDAIAAAHKFVSIYSNEGCNHVQYDPEVRKTRWNKLLYNATINSTTAIVGLDVVRCLEFGKERKGTEMQILRPAMREIISIAATEGIKVEEEQIDRFISIGRKLVYKPSMCIDFEKNQLMEVEVILGNPVRIAEKNGVAVPTLTVLYSLMTLLQAKVKESKGLLKFDEETLKLVEN